MHRGPNRCVVEVIEIDDPRVDLTTDLALGVFARVVAVDRQRDYIRLKLRHSGIAAAWDRRLHDCWWYDPATDHPVDLAEPSAADRDWVAASESLIAPQGTSREPSPETIGRDDIADLCDGGVADAGDA